jgi:hypothetical protein
MLRKIFLLCCLTFSLSAFSQTDTINSGKNEIKINLLYFIPEIAEITYERALTSESAIGLSASYWFSDDFNIKFIANPYFRLYFGEKYTTSGFFIEASAGILSVDENRVEFGPNGFTVSTEDNVIYGGAGVAAGAKFLTKNGFIGEAYIGIGRVFGSENSFSVETYPRLGILLGKRF